MLLLVISLCAPSWALANEVRLHLRAHPGVPDLVCPAPARRPLPSPGRATSKSPGVLPPREALDLLPPLGSAPQPATDPARLIGFKLPAAASDKPLRVGLWGDSHFAAGFLREEWARILAARGLRVDLGYLPITLGRAGVRLPVRRQCVSSGWHFEPAYLAASPGQRVGPALATLQADTPGAYFWLDLRDGQGRAQVHNLRIDYLPDPAGAELMLSADDGRPSRLSLPGRPAVGPGSIFVSASGNLSTLKLRVVSGNFKLQGFALQKTGKAPVQIDLFAFPSATARGWAMLDPGYLRASLAGQPYDAVVLEYGTNEGNVTAFDPQRYALGLEEALKNLREVFPTASCLLIGPTDRGRLLTTDLGPLSRQARSELLLHHARIHREIVEAGQAVGDRYTCAYWDWQSFMGGQGSIYRWALTEPPLAARDLIHLTPAGYRRTASALAKVLGWDSAPAPVLPFEPRPPRGPAASTKSGFFPTDGNSDE